MFTAAGGRATALVSAVRSDHRVGIRTPAHMWLPAVLQSGSALVVPEEVPVVLHLRRASAMLHGCMPHKWRVSQCTGGFAVLSTPHRNSSE
eukprot:2352946-Prymnesium_polylepis.2